MPSSPPPVVYWCLPTSPKSKCAGLHTAPRTPPCSVSSNAARTSTTALRVTYSAWTTPHVDLRARRVDDGIATDAEKTQR